MTAPIPWTAYAVGVYNLAWRISMGTNMFSELMASVQQTNDVVKSKKEIQRSVALREPEVKVIRDHLGISQEKFALLLGVSKRTVENWEQGRRHPTGPARSLLRIVEVYPQHALQALQICTNENNGP